MFCSFAPFLRSSVFKVQDNFKFNNIITQKSDLLLRNVSPDRRISIFYLLVLLNLQGARSSYWLFYSHYLHFLKYQSADLCFQRDKNILTIFIKILTI
jgi:hypothetical protein